MCRKSKILLYGYREFYCIHKKDNISKDIAEDVEPRFDTSNYELDRPLLKRKHNQVFGLMKDGLDGKIIQICWIKSKNL